MPKYLKKITFLLLFIILGTFLAVRLKPVFSQSPEDTSTGQVSRSGIISLLWGDRKAGDSGSPFIIALTDEKGSVTEVQISEALQKKHGGVLALDRRRVKINGKLKEISVGGKTETVLEADSLEPGVPADRPKVLAESLSAVAGSQPWTNVMCKYQDIATEPNDLTYFSGLFSSTKPGLNHYFQEASYGLVNINGTTTNGWYTLPHPRSYYIGLGTSSMLTTIFNDCVALADPVVNFSNFVGINLMFNGELDGSAWGGSRWTTLDGVSRFWYTTWEPPWGYQNQTVLAHEMGHGFGLPHSSGDYGYTYDNKWDVMSDDWANCSRSTSPPYGCLGQHTISYHKDLLQWIPTAQKVIVSNGTRTVALEQLALPQTSNAKMIVLPIAGSTSKFYTVEVRRWAGYDVKLPGEAVIIHNVDTSRLNPAHVVDTDNNGNTGDAGAMWIVGETYSDPASGITVSVDSSYTTGLTVTVTNAFVTPSPTQTLTPTPTPIPGDANGDGKVDYNDYNIWLANYNLTTSGGVSVGDFDGNGKVDGEDYVIWLIHYP